VSVLVSMCPCVLACKLTPT